MKNENYINIQGFMINDLNLKGNELILYAVIYGFSQDGQSEYFGSERYIAKSLSLTKKSVSNLLDKLLEKKLIERVSESHYKVKLRGGKKVSHPGEESIPLGGEESIPNNNNTINNTNSTAKADAVRKAKEIVFFTNEILEEKLLKMELKENSHLDIIASLIREKQIKITNSKQLSEVITRHCKSASKLSGAYSNKEIFDVMKILQDNYKKELDKGKIGNPIDWTLETVLKKLTK